MTVVHGRIGTCDMTKVLETSGTDGVCEWWLVSIIGMTPKNPESFMKVSRTVSEIFGILLSDPVAYLKKRLLERSQ